MSVHSLAITLLLLMVAYEGYGIAEHDDPFKWSVKQVITFPASAVAWWLVLTIVL